MELKAKDLGPLGPRHPGDESDGAEKITTEELEKWKETLEEEEKREEMDPWPCDWSGIWDIGIIGIIGIIGFHWIREIPDISA